MSREKKKKKYEKNQNFSEKIILRNNDVSQCEKYALGFISIDGVNIELCLPFFPDSVSVAKPDDFVQSGSWIKQNPYQEFSIYAVPYGIFPSADNVGCV